MNYTKYISSKKILHELVKDHKEIIFRLYARNIKHLCVNNDFESLDFKASLKQHRKIQLWDMRKYLN
jgi:hypothetical protein